MKQLTPEFFLRTSFDKNIKLLGGGLDFDEGMQENGFDWVFEAMQAYAEHCEESAWVTDGSLPPVDQDSPLTSIWVFTINVDGEIRSNFYHFGQSVLFRGHWHFDKDSVCAWRSLPTPPKK